MIHAGGFVMTFVVRLSKNSIYSILPEQNRQTLLRGRLSNFTLSLHCFLGSRAYRSAKPGEVDSKCFKLA